jgi:hypothetical protein
MSTKRTVIESLRNKLRERNADSNYSNQFLYNTLLEHAQWLIKREIHSGRIYSNNSFFQTLGCQEVIESSTIDPCCPVKVKCKIYRTKNKLPEMWIDNNGPVIRQVTSVDGSTEFVMVNPMVWQNKKVNPYTKMGSTKYAFIADGYLWFPEHNPHRINIIGFYTDDISEKSECSDSRPCVRFLDTPFPLPDWLQAEMFGKALEQLAGVSKRLPEDNQIDKNPTRKD